MHSAHEIITNHLAREHHITSHHIASHHHSISSRRDALCAFGDMLEAYINNTSTTMLRNRCAKCMSRRRHGVVANLIYV